MFVRPLSKELQEKAISEINEVPSRLEKDVKHILEWARQQPHLIMRTDVQFIVTFLRACKFSLQKTKEKLELYHTFRTIAPEFYINRDPRLPEIQECFKRDIFVLLPDEETNPLAPRRMLITSKDADPQVIFMKSGMKAIMMCSEILLWEDDAAAINGQEVIYDLQTIRYEYVAQATPSFVKSLVFMMQHAYPSRLKGIYFINAPAFFLPIVNLAISLFSKKIGNRVSFYSPKDTDNFYKRVPRAVMPAEYGGGAGSIKGLSEQLAAKFESYREWFQEDSKYGTDETKRIGKLELAQDYFGVDGSFRKLEID